MTKTSPRKPDARTPSAGNVWRLENREVADRTFGFSRADGAGESARALVDGTPTRGASPFFGG